MGFHFMDREELLQCHILHFTDTENAELSAVLDLSLILCFEEKPFIF